MKRSYLTKQSRTTSQLIPLEGKIKVEVPKEVLSKIKLLCEVISTVEWSGILLYQTHGSIKDPKNMKILLKDIIPMNKGSKTYTEYSFNEKSRDQTGFSDKHIEYCDEVEEGIFWQVGLIHSHNSFSVFFSGTDEEELIENAPLHNFYLSLIVNNNMDFEARVAISAKTNSEVDLDYTALDEEGNPFKMETSKSILKNSKTFYYDCEIVPEEAEALDLDIFTRNLIDIMDDSQKTNNSTKPFWGSMGYGGMNNINNPYENKSKKVDPLMNNVRRPLNSFEKMEEKDQYQDIYDTASYNIKFILGGYNFNNRSVGSLLASLSRERKNELQEEFMEEFSNTFIQSFEEEEYIEALKISIDILHAYSTNYSFLINLIKDLEEFKKTLLIKI